MSGAAPAWAAVGPAGRFCAAADAAVADAVAADGLASADFPPAFAGTPKQTQTFSTISCCYKHCCGSGSVCFWTSRM